MGRISMVDSPWLYEKHWTLCSQDLKSKYCLSRMWARRESALKPLCGWTCWLYAGMNDLNDTMMRHFMTLHLYLTQWLKLSQKKNGWVCMTPSHFYCFTAVFSCHVFNELHVCLRSLCQKYLLAWFLFWAVESPAVLKFKTNIQKKQKMHLIELFVL